jgi:hypothetical protein
MFWCTNFKNNFLKIKIYYFNIKYILKNNYNHTSKKNYKRSWMTLEKQYSSLEWYTDGFVFYLKKT